MSLLMAYQQKQAGWHTVIRIWARTLAGYVYHYSAILLCMHYALLYAEELPDKLQTLISRFFFFFQTCQKVRT